MPLYYTVNSDGVFDKIVELSPFDAIPRGSFIPPPAASAGFHAYLGFPSWLLVSDADLAEIKRKAAVPRSVTPRQIRQALTRAGYREMVEAAIAAGSQDLKDWYDKSDEFLRDHPLVLELVQALGLAEKDADNVWTLAGSL